MINPIKDFFFARLVEQGNTKIALLYIQHSGYCR